MTNNRWYTVDQVGRLQLEITNYCNARCPQCSREDFIVAGKADWLNNRNISIEDIVTWFGDYEWKNLRTIHFCGDVDEPTLNRDIEQMIEFFLPLVGDEGRIYVATNGGTRDSTFWSRMGKMSANSGGRLRVVFAIDGLVDTNHIYRRQVRWGKLEQNFTRYIQEGGFAIWQFIAFEHNYHQIELAREESQQLGFKNFMLIDSGRFTHEKDADEIKTEAPPEDYVGIDEGEVTEMVACKAMPNSGQDVFDPVHANLYVDFNGLVLPCCWLGNQAEIKRLRATYMINAGLSLHDMELDKILQGGFWKSIWENMEDDPVCQRKCKHNRRDRRYIKK